MHRHLPGAIFLTDQTFNFTIPDATTEPASVPGRGARMRRRQRSPAENIAADAEVIMVEFKDRATFRK